MNTITTQFSFLLTFLIFSCGITSRLNTGEVNYLGKSEQGTMLVSAVGYGAEGFEAVKNAEINAFQTLIFKGVPGSQYHLPMVANEANARQQFSEYFQQLLEGGGYKAFMMQSESYGVNYSGGTLTQQIKINVSSLRRDFEEKGVVRKFGL